MNKFVYVVRLYEWGVGEKMLCAYSDKWKAEEHKLRLENMSGEWDECHYDIATIALIE